MGCCCSCLEKQGSPEKETEMKPCSSRDSSSEKSLSISRVMSAPSIEIKDRTTVSGYGLALLGVAVEQDAAYWEGHVDLPEGKGPQEIMLGVATKKDRKFYTALEQQEEELPDSTGTDLMRKITVSNEDTVGIAVQQSDLPMVQFVLNGEPLHDLAVNRFRGTVYPAIFLPENEGASVRLVFDERGFQQLSPHVRFGPLIVARGLI